MNIEEILSSSETKINFLKGLIRIAKCDKNIDEKEMAYFLQASQSLGLDEVGQMEINDAWNSNIPIEISFETNEQKMFFFIEAIQLCWIDNMYQDIEKKEIRIISQELGISEEAIDKVEEWVREGIEWNNKSKDLLKLK